MAEAQNPATPEEEKPNLDAQKNGTDKYHEIYKVKVVFAAWILGGLTFIAFLLGYVRGWWDL